jgi:hypothetical protein
MYRTCTESSVLFLQGYPELRTFEHNIKLFCKITSREAALCSAKLWIDVIANLPLVSIQFSSDPQTSGFSPPVRQRFWSGIVTLSASGKVLDCKLLSCVLMTVKLRPYVAEFLQYTAHLHVNLLIINLLVLNAQYFTAIYRMDQKSVNVLVKFTLKYAKNYFITYWIYKNCSKWDSPCSMHNSQCCDTVLQIDWQV